MQRGDECYLNWWIVAILRDGVKTSSALKLFSNVTQTFVAGELIKKNKDKEMVVLKMVNEY